MKYSIMIPDYFDSVDLDTKDEKEAERIVARNLIDKISKMTEDEFIEEFGLLVNEPMIRRRPNYGDNRR